MTSLYALPTSAVPIIALEPYNADAELAAFVSAGVRVFIFRGEVDFSLSREPNWDTYDAWALLKRLPGGQEALRPYL